MLSPVSSEDWPAIDSWWSSFTQDCPLILATAPIRELPDVAKAQSWSTVDPLWTAFEADQESLFTEVHIQELSDHSEGAAWETVDDFWNSYTEQQQDELLELQELMAHLDETWIDGASTFEDDPLTTNWRSESQYEGPLRTTINEEDWSQWLAHLLRTSSGPFAQELLGAPSTHPTSVRREVVFYGEGTQRRVDILVEYDDVGISIEVKQGDKHYRKTPETAGLVERNTQRDWSHVLLLQKDKLPRLQQTFGDDLTRPEDSRPLIQSDQSSDIDVRYWQDVSRVLRQVLIEGHEPDSHWEASAYLFITLIEQRILGLHSFSFVESITNANTDMTVAPDIHRLVVAEPKKQIDYLRTILHGDQNHE